MRPDFLIIPKIVYAAPGLQPADLITYAVVYWYEHMRDGKCTASNTAIAHAAGVGERSVRGSLERLEKLGFIRREYRDKKRKDRAQILCLVKYGMPQIEEKAATASIQAPEKPEVDTPGEYARKFFRGDREVVGELGKQLEDAGIPSDFILKEMIKFKSYWTEPTKNGKKQRWELQETFDVKRRLGTWFRNAAERNRDSRRSGSGITI